MNLIKKYRQKRGLAIVRKNYKAIIIIAIVFVLFFVFFKSRNVEPKVVIVDEYAPLMEESDTNLYEEGLILFNQGNFVEARKYFEVALEKKPQEKSYLQHIGIIDYNLKKYDDAISSLEKVLDSDENNFFVLNVLGNVYRDKGDLVKAREYYQKSTISNPTFISPYVNLVMILNDEGKTEEAKNVIKRGLTQNPENFELLQLQKTVK